MKKWNNPAITNLGIENTNEGPVRRPDPYVPGTCGHCGKWFPNSAVFTEHQTKEDAPAGFECPEAPTNGQYESIYIPALS